MAGGDWLGRLSDEMIIDTVGEAAFRRGHEYAERGKVRSVEVEPTGALKAVVTGTQRPSYLVRVRHHQIRGQDSFAGECTCPMMLDCKHVAASVVIAREQFRPHTPAWETVLTDVVSRPTRTAALRTYDAAVQIELSRPGRGTWSGPRRLEARVLRVGRSGKWIKTGISWQMVSHAQVPEVDRGQLVALQALWRVVEAGHGASTWYGSDTLNLGLAPAEVWDLLQACRDAGVALLADANGRPLTLLPSTSRLVLDLVDDEAGSRLAPLVDAGDDDLVTPTLWVGRPTHGFALERRPAGAPDRAPSELVVGGLSTPADEGVTRLLAEEPVTIPAGDRQRFLATYFPRLVQRVPVVSSDASVELPEIRPPRLRLDVVHGAAHSCRLTWRVSYVAPGRGEVLLPLGLDPRREAPGVARDPGLERSLADGLDALERIPVLSEEVDGHRVPVDSVELTGHTTRVFVDEVLPALLAEPGLDVVVEGDAATYQLVEEAPVVALSTHDSDEHDWFDLRVRVTVGGEEVPFRELFVGLAADDTHLLLDSGTWFSLDRDEFTVLRRLIDEARGLQDRPGGPLRLRALHAGLWEDLVALGVVEEQSTRWQAATAALLGREVPDPPQVPTGLTATLRPYQVEGFHWLTQLWRLGLGGVLADDMGLGKTIQTLTLAQHLLETEGLTAPLLIVAPTSVLDTWKREAERFTPDLRVAVLDETTRRRGSSIVQQIRGAHIVVTSYAIFRIDEDVLRRLPWSALVLDEAQAVKNHHAKTYQCARRIEAPFKLAITGTPLENSLMDLWSITSIVAPGLLPGPDIFTKVYRKPIESGDHEVALPLLESLRRRVRPLLLRRTKELVATELPPKQEQVLHIDLPRTHRTIYDRHLQRERQRVLRLIDDDFSANRFGILRALTMLRLLALHPRLVDDEYPEDPMSAKVEALVEQLEEIAAEGHRALVFSQFTSYLSMVRAALDKAGVGYAYLDGSTRRRGEVIEAWRESSDPAFLISLRAGGVGLTLTEADYVFMMDPWWNPAVENQAIDRTHRIGQDKKVLVYRMVSTDTIEERVLALQARKRDLFTSVIDEGAMESGALTEDDIRGLLGG